MKLSRTGGGTPQAGGAQAQKSIGSLSAGDRFTATVSGVSGNQVTLTMSGGGQFGAKSQNPGELTKGQRLSFVVESNENGQVFVKISKDDSGTLLKIAAKSLSEAGLAANEENIGLAKSLLEKGFNPDAGLLGKAVFGMSLKTMTLEKLMFFLEEEMDISQENLMQLNSNIINKNELLQMLDGLAEATEKLPKGERQVLSRLLGGAGEDEKTEPGRLLKKLLFVDILAEKELGKYYKSLYEAVSLLSDGLMENEETSRLIGYAKSVKQALEFQNEIGRYRSYMQIPFVLEGRRSQGDLYVFKDAKGSKNPKKGATALLSLNTASLGYVEAFIEKEGNRVSCAFKLSEPKFAKLFKERSFELHKLMAQKGFRLELAEFSSSENAFNLLSAPPGASEAQAEPKKKKYSFDARA